MSKLKMHLFLPAGGHLAVALSGRDGGAAADCSFTLLAKHKGPHVLGESLVRRLTPRECERLQGFADDYTAINYCGRPAADGHRYKALGNSMSVPVMEWIGRRIALADRFVSEVKS